MRLNRRLLLGTAAAAAASWLPLSVRASGLTLAQIKASVELRIGCEAAYVPFTYRQDGKIVGYDVELAELLCKALGVKANFIDTAFINYGYNQALLHHRPLYRPQMLCSCALLKQ